MLSNFNSFEVIIIENIGHLKDFRLCERRCLVNDVFHQKGEYNIVRHVDSGVRGLDPSILIIL